MGWFRRSEHPEEQLSAFIDGELDARQAETVARHLAACPQCSTLAEELRATRAMLSELPRVAPSRSFVLGPGHATPPKPVRAPARRSSFSFAPAVAATLLIGLVLADAINVSTSSRDESAGGLGAASQFEASRQSTEDSAADRPGPTAPTKANSGAPADAAVTPAGGAGSGTSATPMTAPASGPAPGTAPPVPTIVVAPAIGEATAPVGPLSTFGSDTRAPTPEDTDGAADASARSDDEDGLSTLRLLQILAAIALVASALYVYVLPRLVERK